MLSKDHDGIIICGKRKQGKSTLTQALYANEMRCIVYDAKGDLKEPLGLEAGEIIPRVWQDKGVLRLYVIRGVRPAEELEWAAYLAITAGHCVFVCDELSDALEDSNPPESWVYVTRLGRKRDVRFIYTFQRAAEVPRMATAQASDWYLFQTNEANDLDYIRRSAGKQVAECVRGLPKHHFVHLRDGRFMGIEMVDVASNAVQLITMNLQQFSMTPE
jgi:hypothetical protein